ncbi:MAG: hypothetical protein V4508_00070 [Pseudomonadota bacterium]
MSAPSAAIFVLMLRQAVLYQHIQGYRWVGRLLLATAVGLPLFMLLSGRGVRMAAMGMVPLMLFALMSWQALVGSAMLLNSPANARLVPQARRHAMLAVLAGSVLLALACALVTAFLAGHFLFVALAGCISMSGMALLNASVKIEGFILYALPMFAIYYVLSHSPAMVLEPGQLIALALFTLACGWYALARMFPRRPEAHRRRLDQIERMRAHQAGDAAAAPNLVRGPARWLYDVALRRDCGPGARQGALLMHAFGPRAHWSIAAGVWAAVALLSAAGLLLLASLPLSGNVRDFVQGMTFFSLSGMAAVFLPILMIQAIVTRIAVTGTEQALVRLSPRMAQGRALNRLLATRLLWQTGASALLWLVYLWIVSATSGMTPQHSAMVVGVASTTLLLAGSLPPDLAAMGNPMHVGRPMVVLLIMGALVFGVALLRAFVLPLPWLVLLPVSAALAALLARRYWRAQLAAPVALPAGRLAR